MSEREPKIDHGRNAWRDPQKPRRYRVDMICNDKRRFTDEMIARAAGAVSIGERKNTERLWPYRCRHCAGWHLTSHPQGGVLAITGEDTMSGAAKRRVA